jgi:alpha-L-arabinofuranosidase
MTNSSNQTMLTLALLTALLCGNLFAAEPAATIAIQADQPGARISPTMWGVFFEDINFGADGGLYAEMVKNRSFEFPNATMGWSNVATGNRASLMEIHEDYPSSAANPHYLRVKVYPDCKGSMLTNEGFRGMGIREGEDYNFSARIRAVEGSPALIIELAAPDGRKLAEAKLSDFSKNWKEYKATLHASATEPKAKLNIYIEGQGAAADSTSSRCFRQRPGRTGPAGCGPTWSRCSPT